MRYADTPFENSRSLCTSIPIYIRITVGQITKGMNLITECESIAEDDSNYGSWIVEGEQLDRKS